MKVFYTEINEFLALQMSNLIQTKAILALVLMHN